MTRSLTPKAVFVAAALILAAIAAALILVGDRAEAGDTTNACLYNNPGPTPGECGSEGGGVPSDGTVLQRVIEGIDREREAREREQAETERTNALHQATLVPETAPTQVKVCRTHIEMVKEVYNTTGNWRWKEIRTTVCEWR